MGYRDSQHLKVIQQQQAINRDTKAETVSREILVSSVNRSGEPYLDRPDVEVVEEALDEVLLLGLPLRQHLLAADL